MRHPELYIKEIAGKGRGVVCNVDLCEKTVIEIAPVIVFSAAERKLLDATSLHDYIFEWVPNGEKLCCMALGYVPLYNHACPSNCEYFMDYEAQTIKVETVCPIPAGTELSINYQGDFDDVTPVWFAVK